MNSRPVRVLCLHGIGTNSEVFEAQTARLRYLLGDQYEFDFVDGAHPWPAYPNIAEVFGHNQVYYSYCDDTPQSVRGAVTDLARYAAENGPFEAVMGFSLGAALALTLLLNHEQLGLSAPPFGCAILLCGILPCDWSALEKDQVELLSPSQVSRPVQIPTVHCWSPEDLHHTGQSQKVISMCTPDGRVELVHHAGHTLPVDGAGVEHLAKAIDTTVRRACHLRSA